jgi:hypothetical protein
MAQPIQAEIRTKLAFDKVRRNQRFSSITHGEGDRARQGPVSQQIGHDRCCRRSGCDWPSGTRTKRYQGTGGNTGGRPENGYAIGFCQQKKTKPSPQEKPDANRHGHADRSDPLPGRISDSPLRLHALAGQWGLLGSSPAPSKHEE